MIKKCLKNLLFWLIFLPLLYTLSGFVILPWWARTQLPSLIQEKLGLSISIEKVLFNPFTFELHVNHFALHDTAGNDVATLEHLYINYDPTYLFKKEFFVKSLLLEQPFVDLKIDPKGNLTLLSLFPTNPSSEKNATTDTSLSMPFIIEHVDIQNAKTNFSDERPSEPFKLEIGPINYAVNNLSFYKDDLSIHALKVMLQNEEKISLASSASFDPLKFYGELNVAHLPLSNFWRYALPSMPATLTQGELTLRVPFSIDLSKEKPLVSLEKASASLERVRLIDDANKTVIEVPSLSLANIDFDLQTSTINIEKAMITKPFVDVQLEKDYALNLVRLFTPKGALAQPEAPTPATQESKNEWKFALKTFEIHEASIDVTDKNVKSTPIHLAPLKLTAQNITHDQNSPISYDFNSTIDSTASLNAKGIFIPATASLEMVMNASKLSLEKAQPYITLFTTTLIQDGSLSLTSKLTASFDQKPMFKIEGDATISKFSLADKLKNSLVAWETLNVSSIAYTLSPATLSIQKIMLDKPYINLDIKKDGTTNFSNLLKTPQTPAKTQKSQTTQDAMSIYIGDVTLKRGTTHFKDASLLLPFATFADRLNGSMSTLDTKNTKPSVLKLEGKVDKYGYAKIDGSVLPFDFKNRATLKILFKNIDMPSLSPYTSKFIGYTIKEGKLSMDLNYKIKKGVMEGANKINLDSLLLGEKIESKDATNLPLGLAIAILKDSKGQIDLDLPVSGDLNDPEFRYGSIIWKAIENLIGSIATSPFKLLGSILGIETENLKSIDFAAGEFALIASEEEKIEQYRLILDKRAELKLIITPSFNETLDTKALQEQNVTAQIEALIPKKSKEDDSYGKAIKKLFLQKYSDDAYDHLLKTYKEENLDMGAIHDALISKIAEGITIAPEVLQNLALKRSDTIIQTLTTKYKIAPERLIKNEPQTSDAIREEWVGCPISISN
ncbi:MULTISPECIES: DUF748 domain-containing protein [unclassified Sulfurospirillum]|uniref:DUF748 domain-containing protein n=1 Tax=unclassified Sulfurospirillum TaxID=2618290 RepID=UPI000AD1330C|nr:MULTISPECIES: DUF748 domain-containing protein [unclassified Sulfurospirillum]